MAQDKGGKTISKQYSPDFYEKIGEKDGETISRKYGSQFFKEIGHKRGQKLEHLVEGGKRRA